MVPTSEDASALHWCNVHRDDTSFPKCKQTSQKLRVVHNSASRVFPPSLSLLCPDAVMIKIDFACFWQVLHPLEHRELEAKLKEPQSRVRLEAALTQLKSTMDAKKLHYEDLSGRPKNLCVSLHILAHAVQKRMGICRICHVRRLPAALS